MHNTDKRPSLARFNSSIYLVEDEHITNEEPEETKNCCYSCCCFNGVFWCIIGMVYFFLLLPTGLLLLIFGFNHEDYLSLFLGALVIVTSTCGLPSAIFGCRWWRKRRRQRRCLSTTAASANSPAPNAAASSSVSPPRSDLYPSLHGSTRLVDNEHIDVSAIGEPQV